MSKVGLYQQHHGCAPGEAVSRRAHRGRPGREDGLREWSPPGREDYSRAPNRRGRRHTACGLLELGRSACPTPYPTWRAAGGGAACDPRRDPQVRPLAKSREGALGHAAAGDLVHRDGLGATRGVPARRRFPARSLPRLSVAPALAARGRWRARGARRVASVRRVPRAVPARVGAPLAPLATRAARSHRARRRPRSRAGPRDLASRALGGCASATGRLTALG